MTEEIEQIQIAENIFFYSENIPLEFLSLSDRKELKVFYDSNSEIKFSNSFRLALYKMFFCLKVKKSKTGSRSYYFIKLKRLLAVADILRGLSARKSSVRIYEYCLNIAIKNKLDWAIIKSSRQLYTHAAYFESNIKKANRINKIFEEAKKKNDLEIECEKAFIFIAYHFTKSKEHTLKIKQELELNFEHLDSIPNIDRSILFNRYLRFIGIMNFEVKNDIGGLIDYLAIQVKNIKSCGVDLPSDLNMTYKYLCEYSLRIEKYSLFDKYYSDGISLVKKRSGSWFRYRELLALQKLRQLKFIEAQDILLNLINTRSFTVLQHLQKRRIELKLLYVSLILIISDKRIKKSKSVLNKYNDYFQSMPEYRTDKKAMNISLIIFQLIYYVWKKDYEMLDLRFEAVDKYLRRYTKSSPLFRSHSFIRILLTLKRYNFITKGAERNYVRYLENLQSMPFKSSPHPGEIEIIFYEDLIESINSYLSYDRKSKTG